MIPTLPVHQGCFASQAMISTPSESSSARYSSVSTPSESPDPRWSTRTQA